jgi:hypothetical protein
MLRHSDGGATEATGLYAFVFNLVFVFGLELEGFEGLELGDKDEFDDMDSSGCVRRYSKGDKVTIRLALAFKVYGLKAIIRGVRVKDFIFERECVCCLQNVRG